MSTFNTQAGKEVSTFVAPGTAFYRVKFNSGGELPEQLTGIFTSEKLADIAINCYLAEKEKPIKTKGA